jgi:hypothetical protein
MHTNLSRSDDANILVEDATQVLFDEAAKLPVKLRFTVPPPVAGGGGGGGADDDEAAARTKAVEAATSAPEKNCYLIRIPMPEIWQTMVDFALRPYGGELEHKYVCVMGNALMAGTHLAEGHVNLFYGLQIFYQGHHEDRRWFQVRFAAPLFALSSLELRSRQREESDADAFDLSARAAEHAYVRSALSDEDIECLVADGISNLDWEIVQRVSCAWLRTLLAARSIQRAWRRRSIAGA